MLGREGYAPKPLVDAQTDKETEDRDQAEVPLLPTPESISFLSDAECEDLFAAIRWPNGRLCPRCRGTEAYDLSLPPNRARQWRCTECCTDYSLTNGTPFSGRKASFRAILTVLSIVQRNKGEVVILRLSEELSINYKTMYMLVGKATEFLVAGIDRRSVYIGYNSSSRHRRTGLKPRAHLAAIMPRACVECATEKPAEAFSLKCGSAGYWGLRGRVCKECVARRTSKGIRATWVERKEAAAAEPIIHRPAAELLAEVPRRRPWLFNSHMRWTPQEKHDLLTLCAAGVKVEDAGNALWRSPSSIAWYARDIAPKLPKDWSRLITRPRIVVPAAPRLLVYPYLPSIPKTGDFGGELIMEVNGSIPRHLPDHIRADIAQEILLAILAGELPRAELSAATNRMIRKRLGMTRADLSLDSLLDRDDKREPLSVTLPVGVIGLLEW